MLSDTLCNSQYPGIHIIDKQHDVTCPVCQISVYYMYSIWLSINIMYQ